jgi:chromosome transmission fidelity protein 1
MAFPTGRSVSFPYENPYPQQVALMDTLLKTLQELDQRKRTLERTAKDTEGCLPTVQSASCPVLMLESPTGTGKSLSLACAAIAWLRHVEEQDLRDIENGKEHVASEILTAPSLVAPTGLDWVDDWIPPEQRDHDHSQHQIRLAAASSRAALNEELRKIESKFLLVDDSQERQRLVRANLVRTAISATKANELRAKGFQTKRPCPSKAFMSSRQPKSDDFCLDDYRSGEETQNSDDDTHEDHADRGSNNERQSSSSANNLLRGSALDGSGSVGNANNKSAVGGVTPGTGVRKIVYAARTHSQLSQFVGELRRTGHTLRVVALGGRKTLCGNREVRHKTESALTEACLDLQKGTQSGTTSSGESKKRATNSKQQGGGCPLLASRSAVDVLALHTLAHVSDIEEAASLGESSQTCAYYASRSSLPAAEVVVMPYSMLLSSTTRTAIGLSLKEALVIVDEAHNLPEALRSLHSCRLSLPVVQGALAQLGNYVNRYAQRLSGHNIQYLGQIRKILVAFEKCLNRDESALTDSQKLGMQTPAELMIDCKLDNFNLFKLLNYLERSRLSQKLLGFTNHSATVAEEEKANDYANGEEGLSKHVSAMSVVQTFLEKLVHTDKEGKVVIDWPGHQVETDSRSSHGQQKHAALRYVLLQPAAFFQNVLKEAHALALVGGTLRPFVHVAAELLGDHPSLLHQAEDADAAMEDMSEVSKSFMSPIFTAFTCDHVVPSSNVLLQFWAQGVTGISLDFRHQSRSIHSTMDELGQTILKICSLVPNGVVVFLPSYSYEAQLVLRWKRTGLWQALEAVKKTHREPRTSQQIEAALQIYGSDAADRGAVLLSVIGGKMSEGINFSNEMCRCVIIIGLPYPNIIDPEIQEKMALMDRTCNAVNGQAYYQNLCLRAINQSVGRAIRHGKDYSAVLLLDRRYMTDRRIRAGLPAWLKRGESSSADNNPHFQHRLDSLQRFFESMSKI